MELVTRVRRIGRRTRAALVIAALAVGTFGVVWFGPQYLFLNETADEALPATAADLRTLAEGSLGSLAHETTGTVRLVESADGTRYLRFEDLDSLNGPDLRVYLSSAPADADPGAFDDTLVLDLGELTANRGSFNYEVPADADLSEVRSVSIWCRRFAVGFGVAPLEVAG
jgi:hypothetical protein